MQTKVGNIGKIQETSKKSINILQQNCLEDIWVQGPLTAVLSCATISTVESGKDHILLLTRRTQPNGCN